MSTAVKGGADDQFWKLKDKFEKFRLDWKRKCVGHSFDGASVMQKLAENFAAVVCVVSFSSPVTGGGQTIVPMPPTGARRDYSRCCKAFWRVQAL